jgi:hypothetical protein
MASGMAIRADQAVRQEVFERRSCGTTPEAPATSD